MKVENETRQNGCAASSCLPVQTASEETCGFEVQFCGSEFECDDIRGLLSDTLHAHLQEAPDGSTFCQPCTNLNISLQTFLIGTLTFVNKSNCKLLPIIFSLIVASVVQIRKTEQKKEE